MPLFGVTRLHHFATGVRDQWAITLSVYAFGGRSIINAELAFS
jgi:hypothetical protein